MENKIGNLEKIVIEFLQRTVVTKRIELGTFFQQMENEFARLGYREPVRGGWWKTFLFRGLIMWAILF